MIRKTDRRAALGGLAALALGAMAGALPRAAVAQAPAPSDEWETEGPDIEAAKKDGFTLVELAERPSDDRTAMIRERFVVPVEQAVGQDGTHDFEWGLADLNGDGLSDVVIVPRAPGLGLAPRYEGIRILVYVFDGKEWHKALDGGGQGVAWRDVDGPDGTKAREVALLQPGTRRYVFRWDGKAFVEVPA